MQSHHRQPGPRKTRQLQSYGITGARAACPAACNSLRPQTRGRDRARQQPSRCKHVCACRSAQLIYPFAYASFRCKATRERGALLHAETACLPKAKELHNRCSTACSPHPPHAPASCCCLGIMERLQGVSPDEGPVHPRIRAERILHRLSELEPESCAQTPWPTRRPLTAAH